MKTPSKINQLTILSEGKADVVTVDAPELTDKTVVLKTLFSGISHGTELSAFNRTLPGFNKKWDKERLMYGDGGTGTKEYPISPGYENIGEVIFIGENVKDVSVGDVLWVDAGHQDYSFVDLEQTPHFLINVPENLERFTSLVLARVALAGVHDSGFIIGDDAFVAGLGTIGIITAQLLKMAGANNLMTSEPINERREFIKTLDIDSTDPTSDNYLTDYTAKEGYDVAIETSGTSEGLLNCMKVAKKNGVVTVVSTIREDLVNINLSEEFSKKGLKIVSSMSVNGCAHKKFPNWDLQRLNKTAFSLIKRNLIDTSSYITHRYDLSNAKNVYSDIADRPEEVLKAIITY